jgi:hypothetical protein
LPPEWEPENAFTITGYQQGESAVLRAPGGTTKVDINVYHSDVDAVARALVGTRGSNAEFLVAAPVAFTTASGLPGAVSYLRVTGEISGVALYRIVSLGEGWYLALNAFFPEPYRETAFAEVRAVVDSIAVD